MYMEQIYLVSTEMIFYSFIMHNAVIRMDLSIVLFCNAAGRASTTFQPRLGAL